MYILQKAYLICSTVHQERWVPAPFYIGAFLWSCPPRRRGYISWGNVNLQEEGSILKCPYWQHGVSLSIRGGEGHGEKIFPFKEPRVTFRIGPSAAELKAQMQRDLCLSLPEGMSGLGNRCQASFAGRFMRLHIPRR